MKFRTRLLITSVTIVLLPLLLTCAALLVVGSHIEDVETPSDFFDRDNVSYIYTVETYSRISEEVLEKVRRQIEEDPSRLEDKDYLDEIASDLKDKSSYIIIRKNDMLSYTSNSGDAKKIFPALPEYGNEMPGSEAGYYYSDIRKLVKKVDFCFSDGAEGSFFVITSVSSLLSRKMLLRMAFAFILVLVFTSFLLTQWFRKGIFTPINQLNTAMQNIAEGNLEYMLTTEEKGEIGELYRNYEDMRLRLKESLDEKFEHEKKNRELISNISHDLKTPITAVKGYVEGIMDGVADTPEKMDKYIKTIYNKANEIGRAHV